MYSARFECIRPAEYALLFVAAEYALLSEVCYARWLFGHEDRLDAKSAHIMKVSYFAMISNAFRKVLHDSMFI